MILASLKFHNARHVNSQSIYRTTRRHCTYHQCYTHHRLKTAVLGDDRFAALGDSSTIISCLCKFILPNYALSYCKIDSQL
jgi:hypothetical protein